MLGEVRRMTMSRYIVPWMKERIDKCRFLLFGDESSYYTSDKYMFMQWSWCDELVV